MRWALRRIDSLFGTVIGAVSSLSASQVPIYLQHYLQRLGGHLDEARLAYRRIVGAGQGHTEVAEAFQARIDQLQAIHDALTQAPVFVRPYAFLKTLDRDIALATLDGFAPAFPLDPASLAYAAAGLVIGWFLYEAAKGVLGPRASRRHARGAG